MDEAVTGNIERIRDAFGGEADHLSTSQKIMAGLALCRPELLEQANYPAADIKAAWARLDDAQREAIIFWWKDAPSGVQINIGENQRNSGGAVPAGVTQINIGNNMRNAGGNYYEK